MKARDLIAAVRDEIDTFRAWDTPELSIDYITKNKPTEARNYLATLHAPISRCGKSLTDNERHKLMSAVFGRHITSASQVTNVEATAFSRVCHAQHSKDVGEVIEEILND